MSEPSPSISCISQECHRMMLNLKNKEYVLNHTDGYFVNEHYNEVEDIFHQHNITIVKKYQKTEEGKMNIYVLTENHF